MQELDELLELLELERQEDFEQFKQKVESLPLEKRKAEGLSWYPVQILQKGYTIGDRAFVTVGRTHHLEDNHQFRAGMAVRLFTRQPGAKRSEHQGVVYFADRQKMRIILNARELPDWLDLGLVGVDLLFDERTYQEMAKALRLVRAATNGRLAELRDIFLGKKAPLFEPVRHTVALPELNPSQNRAVNQALAARDVAVIHGPPGTGKTTTLVQVVRQLAQTEAGVLVTAPSNTAVDLLTEKLAAAGLNVVRIGNISRVDDSILSHTLELQIANHPESKHIKKVKQQAAELRRKAQRYKRTFTHDDRLERGSLYREAGELMAWARQLEERLIDEIIDGAQVITCTLVGAANQVLSRRKFRTVVIDEAAQALEPATWIPILKASRVILAGDPFQLPPTVKSIAAERRGFNITLIEKCLQRMEYHSLLNVQYRMHEKIMGFSNQQFYQGALQAAPEVADHRLPIKENCPILFIDTAGCGFQEKVHEKYQSRYNPEEFQILAEHLHQLLQAFHELREPPPSIALISPYREQVVHMEATVQEDAALSGQPVAINTIDGFQGQEKDVVYLSLVRSNEKGQIGFLKDYRRMNVAMTRARQQLIIVGDSATIGGDPFYARMLAYCESEGRYQTAWEYMM